MHQIRNCTILFALILCVAMLSMILVYALPIERIQENVIASAEIFEREGAYPTLQAGDDSYLLDNFTDALMLDTAAYKSHYFPIKASMLNERFAAGDTPVEALLNWAYGEASDNEEIISYARYWHGYLIFLKPLLLFFSYKEIREILYFVQFALAGAIIGILGVKKQFHIIFPFVIMWLFVNPDSISMSMQYSSMTILTFVSLIALITVPSHFKERSSQDFICCLFFAVGCLASFFDLLTFPIITLGIPLCYLLASYEDLSGKQLCKAIIILCIAWGIGYGAMWASKWVLASLITDQNVIVNAYQQIKTRAGNVAFDEAVTYEMVIQNNRRVRYSYLQISEAFAGISILVYLMHQVHSRKFQVQENLLALLLISSFPYIWFAATQNHSYIHYCFTYRDLSVEVFALFTIASCIIRSVVKRRKK